MCISARTVLRVLWSLLVASGLALLPLQGRSDTVASLLGDFTINQYCGVRLTDDTVNLHFVVVYGQLPALRELHLADRNGDGVTTQQERDDYVGGLVTALGQHLAVTLDGAPVTLQAVSWRSSLPKEQSGFSLRVDVEFAAALPASASPSPRELRIDNMNYPGRIGWHEIAVSAAQGLRVFDTDAYADSMTGELTQALQSLPASGPLDERAVHLKFTARALPPGAVAMARRAPGESIVVPPSGTDGADTAWLRTQTQALIRMISTPDVPLRVAALALLASMALGALHALSPGHGKSIVGAYLVGSRGTPRHAVFLGMTVTVTHTLVVFALGLATLFASQYVVPQTLFPILGLLSGLIVLVMGLVLLVQRWPRGREAWGRFAGAGGTRDRVGDADLAPHRPAVAHTHGHAFGHDEHEHEHEHEHPHPMGPESGDVLPQAHAHGVGPGLVHSHGGSAHTHAIPGGNGEAITWRGLLSLGVSGGLLPCPSAMVLLLAAVALNKTWFGLALVVAFSVGLAITLSVIGILFLYARNRLGGHGAGARWPRLLPVVSAASIAVLGALLCYGTLSGLPI